MRPITASDLMNPSVVTVREELTVQQLAAFLIDNEISGAPVEDAEGRVIGVVSLADIAVAASAEGDLTEDGGSDFYARGWKEPATEEDLSDVDLDEEDLTVADIMTPEIFSVLEGASVSEIASTMLQQHLHRLLVTRGEKVVGIISTSDLLGLLVEEG